MTARAERAGSDAEASVEDLDGPGSGLPPAPTESRREWATAVGRRLRALRELAGLTPEDAVDRIRDLNDATEDASPGPDGPLPAVTSGLDAACWRSIERGTAGALDRVTLDEVFLIAWTFGVTAEQLMRPASPLADPAAADIRRAAGTSIPPAGPEGRR